MKPNQPRPPRLAKFLLRQCLQDDEISEKLGDFEEGFTWKNQEYGLHTARNWYRWQVLKYIPFYIKLTIYWSIAMFKNYLKIATRNIQKHKGYSFINITGLALGMASCILILLWVNDELATDRYHEKIDSIYQVRSITHYGSEVSRTAGSVPAIAPALKAEFPEVINAARFQNGQSRHLLKYGNKQFKENCQLADPEIFEIFSFSFTRGDPRQTFGDPYVMVLSERIARKFFGSEDPIGKIMTMDNKDDFRIVGVMKNIPHNSTHRFDIWAPLQLTQKWYRPNYLRTWYNMAFRSYVEMTDGVDISAFNEKIFSRIRQSAKNTNIEPYIYPLNRVYLHIWERIENIRIFSLIAFIILLIACINFMNLATARSAHRAREVGLRKVVGAHRYQIIRQFLGESMFFTFLALLIAVGLVLLLLPAFRTLTGKPIEAVDLANPSIIIGIVSVACITGILAGCYPAFFLSSFRPIATLKGTHASGKSGSFFRKGLVFLQFALSIMLIVGTLIIFNQLRFMKNKNLGLDRKDILGVAVEGKMLENISSIKHQLLQHNGIHSVTATSHSPTGVYNNGHGWDWEGRPPNVDPLVTYFGVDPDFLDTFKMEIVSGESFPQQPGHSLTSVIINECFAGIIGLPDVIGTTISSDDTELQIIGVVKDFHFTPVDQEIGPAIVYYDPTFKSFQRYRYLFMRLNPGNTPATVSHVEKTLNTFNPGFLFEYRFLDEIYDRLYLGVERELVILRTFTILAILISCLGLFGLAAYTAERRTKEIGIRKVLGASVPGIVMLLSREYARWVVAANIIAWPVSYFLMKNWLQDYAYRISLGFPVFLLATAMTLLIAQLTVGFQSIKAARSHPSDSLRYE